MTTQRLADLPTVSDQERTSAIGIKGEAERPNRVVFSGLIIMFMGAAIGILGKMLLHVDIVSVVGVLISLAGMFLAVYPYLLPSSRQKDYSNLPARPEVLTPSQTTKYLPQDSNAEYLPSVTERTTDLLKNSATARPAPQEKTGIQTPDKNKEV